MAENNKDDKDNLIDLASERRRFQNRPTQAGPKKYGSQAPNILARKSAQPTPKPGPRWFHYVQLVAFLALLAWIMSRCQSGGL